MQQNHMLKISFILFFLPLLALFAGGFCGYLAAGTLLLNYKTASLAGAAIFFVLSLTNIYFQERHYRFQPNNFAKIVEVVS
jgi:hypothetical protein